jgi:alpha-N-arabinofuranosidase
MRLVAWTALFVVSTVAARADDPPAPPPVRLTLDTSRTVNPVDVRVYGHFLEHIYHSVNGGLWGEVVWNRSFEQRPTRGLWSSDGQGEVVQKQLAEDVRRVFGDPAWTDYELTLEARKDAGAEGFLILLRSGTGDDAGNFYWANLGGWGNGRHGLERGRTGERQHEVDRGTPGRIEPDRWYRIRARCEGPHIQVWIDDQPVIDFVDREAPHLAGAVGLGTWNTRARFRNVKLTSLDGQTTLLDGIPPEGPESGVAKFWTGYGPGQFGFDIRDPFNSHASQTVRNETTAEVGLAQTHLVVRKGDALRGSIWFRGSSPKGLAVRLLDGETVLAQTKQVTFLSEGGTTLPLVLDPSADCDDATLQIAALGPCSLAVDQVSLMPDSSAATGGFRPDLLAKMDALQAPLIRWPGGCFASAYRWKDGIGPQDRRTVYPIEIWDDKDVNSFGTDEFLALCRKLKTEPVLVLNVGTPGWNANDWQSHDFVQDALDWVDYCNAPADTTWGKVRAANGHPEPYGVKYWEIDNETWGLGAERYAEVVKTFATALRKKDPSLVLIACGSGGLGQRRDGQDWNRSLVRDVADLVDVLSIHHYESPDRFADGPAAFERYLSELSGIVAASRNPRLQVFVSEWNAQSTDWRTGLYAGGILNAFERSGGLVTIASPALFLRHVVATDWDNAFINFDNARSFVAPNHVVMALWRRHHQPRRVGLEGDSGPLNVVATASEDGQTAVLKIVNPTDRAVPVELIVPATLASARATVEVVQAPSLSTRNTLDAPEAIVAKPVEVRLEAGVLHYTAPPLSAGCVNMSVMGP